MAAPRWRRRLGPVDGSTAGQSFIRALIHDTNRRPINASHRRRYPTTRQKRVVLETHNHECVDCQQTDLLELDHNPPYNQTRHTLTCYEPAE